MIWAVTLTVTAICSSGLAVTIRLWRMARIRRRVMYQLGINGDAREIATGDVEDESLRLIKQSVLTLAIFSLPFQLAIEPVPLTWRAAMIIAFRNSAVLLVHVGMTLTSLRREIRRREWISRKPPAVQHQIQQATNPTHK